MKKSPIAKRIEKPSIFDFVARETRTSKFFNFAWSPDLDRIAVSPAVKSFLGLERFQYRFEDARSWFANFDEFIAELTGGLKISRKVVGTVFVETPTSRRECSFCARLVHVSELDASAFFRDSFVVMWSGSPMDDDTGDSWLTDAE